MTQVDDVQAADGRGITAARIAAFALKPFLLLGLLVLLPLALHGGGLLRLPALFDRGEIPLVARAAAELPHALARLKAASADVPALAGEATQEGHWRFVNRAGETLTAGSPEEMQRVASILLPEVQPDTPVVLYLTPTSLLQRRGALVDLPKRTRPFVVFGDVAMPVLGRSETAAEKLYIEVRPKVLIETGEPASVRELLWQMLRPIDRAGVRILALETGGPKTLASAPRMDPVSGRPQIDVIDPDSLAAAMSAVRGQMLVASGRLQSGVLYVKPSSGPERGVLVKDLFAAAENADVNLVLLESGTTPRQPGGRNWLWQRVEVQGLEKGLERPRMADLFDAVGGASGTFLATASAAGASRTLLQLEAAPQVPGAAAPRGLGERLMGSVSELTGRVVVARVEASLRNAERQREIDRRVFLLIPSSVQFGYVALVVLGLVGVPTSRRWWARVWPAEDESEYAGRAGYLAAHAIRETLYVLMFLPLTAVPAAPIAMFQMLLPRNRPSAS